MSRLLASLRCDVTIQARHGFYLVSALLVPLLGWLLGQLAIAPQSLDAVAPVVMAVSLLVTTFFFVGALVLLEKAQGSLNALATSPMRPAEYLASKVVTLTLLGVAEGLAIVWLAFGVDALELGLAVGGLALGALYVLLGFVIIARHEGFNEYLLPAIGVTMALFLPLVHVTGVWESFVWFAHPVFPAVFLMQGPTSFAGWAYGVAGGLFWIAVASAWSHRVYTEATTTRSGAVRRATT